MDKHIIHRQQVVLEIDRQQDAFDYQNKISGLFNNGLQSAIDDVLNEVVAPGEVIRIDTLQLDLGVIDAKNFEKEFKAKIITLLRKAVQQGKSNTGNNVNVEMVKQPVSYRDAVIYFLQHGSLPWYSDIKNIITWQEQLFKEWKTADWVFFTDWVKREYIHQPVVLQRLVSQFCNNFLAQVAGQAYFVENGNITATINWLEIYDDVSYIAHKITDKNSAEVKQVTWINILSAILLQTQPAGNENICVQILLKQLFPGNESLVSALVSNQAEIIQHVKAPVVKNMVSTIVTTIKKILYKNGITELKPGVDDFTIGDVCKEDISKSLQNILNTTPGSENTNEYGKQPAGIEAGEVQPTPLTKPLQPPIETSPKVKQVKKEDVTFITNCGLVLLHPFLGAYFSDLGLLEKKQFISKDVQQRAILLLHYLATGEVEAPEFGLVLQKILCGYPAEETLTASIELSDKEIEESAQLLRTIIDYWPPLKNTSVIGFQGAFLQREGKLSTIQSGWLLQVEQKTVDILLGKLPWDFSTIRLPWMKDMINVEWA